MYLCSVVVQSRCSDYTQVLFFFFFLCVKGFHLRALGVSAGLWQRLNFSLRNGEAKQTELSAFRLKLNRRTTVWPAVHNILFQLWLHLKQTLQSTSAKERGVWEKKKKSLDLSSINKSSFSHIRTQLYLLRLGAMFLPYARQTLVQIFSLSCHLCRSCVLCRHARSHSKGLGVCRVGWERGLKRPQIARL